MDEIAEAFLIETREILGKLDNHLLALEKDPASPDLLSEVFRAVHTVKGSCSFLGFSKLEAVAHAGEDLLARLRAGERAMDPDAADALLGMVDAIRAVLAGIESSGQEPPEDHSALVSRLKRLAASDPVPPVREARAAGAEVREAAETTVRVAVGLLDGLMNRVGELVLTRNRFLAEAAGREESPFWPIVQSLDAITAELQQETLKTRMQPVDTLWKRFPRTVRDLAVTCGKRVELDLEGGGTELDRTVIEAIKDPLTHIVRNAVDHGIEAPELRAARGKPAAGRLLLRASHAGGQVRIEIADDGAGLDLERIRSRAAGSGLVPAERAAAMGERELLELVFLPGFSTSDEVTTVSGRGVGMDVVRSRLKSIGGSVELDTRLGKGTTVRMQIPLTVAIIPAFIAACRGQRFAISRKDILELVRPGRDGSRAAIENLGGTPVCRLRGRLLPLVFLDRELGLAGAEAAAASGSETVVVLAPGERRFGLVVDEVLGAEEIVVRSLSGRVRDIPVYSGSTLMGDGSVVLILDADGLARKSRLDAGEAVREGALSAEAEDSQEETGSLYLLARAPDDGRMAIDLGVVERLEHFERNAVERVGGLAVVKYDHEILPLVEVSDVLVERRRKPRGVEGVQRAEGNIHSAVCRCRGRRVGVVVDRILDILADPLSVRRPPSREGVSFTAVMGDRVVEILDVERIVSMADPDPFSVPGAARGGGE